MAFLNHITLRCDMKELGDPPALFTLLFA
jgi:hypothetical protein